MFPALTATAPRNLCLAKISVCACLLCLLKILLSTSVRLLSSRILYTRTPSLTMIIPSFLFLFSPLVNEFTYRIRNLPLGTGMALLFPSTKAIMDFPLTTYIGRRSLPASPSCSLSSWPWLLLPDAATSGPHEFGSFCHKKPKFGVAEKSVFFILY